MEIRLRDIYKHVNIPTLLILPVFAYQISKTRIRRKDLPPVPLYMLMFEYGLVSSYVELDDTLVVPEPASLIIQFKKEVLENKNLTMSEYHSLNDRLVSSEFVSTVWTQGDHVFYQCPMAVNIVDDVIKIMDSKYTEVSDFYKQAIDSTRVAGILPSWPDNLGYFIMAHNLSLAVLKKHRILRAMTKEELGVDPESMDLFRKFSLTLDVYRPELYL